MRVCLKRIEPAMISDERARDRSVKPKICADVEHHRFGLQETSKKREEIGFHFPPEKVIGGIEGIGVHANVFAGAESNQSPIGTGINWRFHVVLLDSVTSHFYHSSRRSCPRELIFEEREAVG